MSPKTLAPIDPPATDAAYAAAEAGILAEAHKNPAAMTDGELAENLLVNQMIGIAKYGQMLDKINKVATLKALQRIKDSKSYKTLALPGPDGGLIRPKTWEGMCGALGFSRTKIDEDMANLAAFGEELLERQTALGIGYRDLRLLRAGLADLPEAEREHVKGLIARAVAGGDVEEMRTALAEVEVRNKTLEAARDEALAEAEARGKARDRASTRAVEAETALLRHTNPATEAERQKNLREIQTAVRSTVDEDCGRVFNEVMILANNLGSACAADAERPGDQPLVMDGETWTYVNNRVTLLCLELRDTLFKAGLDVDLAAEFDQDAVDAIDTNAN